MTIRIDVTAEDIAEGIRGACKSCPVARAASRAFRANVTAYYTYIITDEGRYLLPDEVQEFMYGFDVGRRGKPFSFEVQKAFF